MAKKRTTKMRDVDRATGMWSTTNAAVESGWGPTLRLLSVLTVRGALLIGVAVVATESGVFDLINALLARLP